VSGCSQYVAAGGERSETAPYEHGVPQGSVFRPLLFSLYVAPVSVHRLTLRVSCTDTNHRGHCALAPLQPCTGLMPLLTSTNIPLLSLHQLPGTIYLLPSTILAPWALSKLLWKHNTSLRLHVMPLTAIHRRLRFTPSWLLAPTEYMWLIDWLTIFCPIALW